MSSQIVMPMRSPAWSMTMGEVAGSKPRRITLGQVDRRVDIGSLCHEPSLQDQVVITRRTVDNDSGGAADPAFLACSDQAFLKRHDPAPPRLLLGRRHVVGQRVR